MNRKTPLLVLAILTFVGIRVTAAPLGTAFTYQGRLNDGPGPANGSYDFTFTLYDATSSGSLVAGPLTNAVAVSNGLFVVTLDFGAGVFAGEARWLEMGVRPNGEGAFTTLSPRQPLTSMPNALYAPNAGTAAMSSNLLGTLPDAQLSTNVVLLTTSPVFTGNITAPSFMGAFSGDGSALTNVDAAGLNGLQASSFWKVGGNSNTTGKNFLGTTDNQPLELRVNGLRGFRLQSVSNDWVPVAVNVIAGSPANYMSPDVVGSVICGGGAAKVYNYSMSNCIHANFAAIGGGGSNQINYSADHSVIGGGFQNVIGSASYECVIGGGNGNRIRDRIYTSVICGGIFNTVQDNCVNATICGGAGNSVENSSLAATVAGGYLNTAAGHFSFAAGTQAKAVHVGAFVWGDAQYQDITSTNNNSFTARAIGGFRLVTAIDGAGTPTSGAYLPSGSGAWLTLSDRNVKENFKAVDPRTVLEKVSRLPVTEWNLMSQPASIRHIGPMAQDFQAAFGVGEDDRHISTTDADGVALAAIQGLNQVVKEKEARIQKLEKDVAELKAMVNSLLKN